MSGEKLHLGRAGRVVEVNFQVGQRVARGDVLIRLDTGRIDNDIARCRRSIQSGDEELARLDRMQGLLTRQLEAARVKAAAELAQAQAGVRLADGQRAAEIDSAEARLAEARREHATVRRLLIGRGASQTEYATAATRLREAEAAVVRARLPVDAGKIEVARRAVALVESEASIKQEELTIQRGQKRSEVDRARLDFANLELERQQMVIRSHVDGVVTIGEVRVGDVLEAGKPVVAVAQQRGLRIDVAVPSKDMAHLRVGMTARVTLDAFDPRREPPLQGRIVFIAPDSDVPEGQQTPYYQVKIALDDDRDGRVKIGLTGQAEIVTGREPLLSLLLKRVSQAISLH